MANLIFKNRPKHLALGAMAALLFLLGTAAIALPQTPGSFSIDQSPLPPPTGYVNDYVGVFDPAAKQELETKLKTFKDTSSPPVEIAVAVIKTTGGRDISEYALAVYRGWKIGTKEADNPGALLLVAVDDRKYFTEVGRDLEDELPDGLVGSLQRQYLVPQFKQGNYAKGISDTIDAYIQTIRDKGNGAVSPTPAPRQPRPAGNSGGSSLFCCAVILLIFFLILITRSRGGRGGGGGFGGGFGSALPWIISGVVNAAANSGSSSSWGSSDSGGSSWGGGGSDWGGGGGFGGFGGGGDSGGGGAGGSW